MITITDLKDILTSKAGGKPLSKIPNFYAMSYQAMLALKAKTDLPSAIRTAQITNPVYSDVKIYPMPTDAQLGAIFNLKQIPQDVTIYDYSRTNARQIALDGKYGTTKQIATKNIDGIEYLVIDVETTSPQVIHTCESTSANGTVTPYGVSTNLQVDTLQKIAGSGSLSFKNGIGSSNGLEFTNISPVNLATQNDILFYVYIPNTTNLSGLKMSLGQSSGHYFSGSIATDFFGNALKVGFNLVKIPKSAFSVGGGSPTWNGIIYARFELIGTFTTEVDGWRIDSLSAQVGSLFEVDYYSNLQFQNTSGVRIMKPTSDNDYIVLQDDELDLYLGFLIEIIAVDLKQLGATIDVQQYGGSKLIDATNQFKLKYPSLRKLPTQSYGRRPLIQ